MTAATATDESGVQYLFQETSGNLGGMNSDWQDGPTYTNADLCPGLTYTYRVKARDRSPNANETAYSSPASATTVPMLQNDTPEQHAAIPKDFAFSLTDSRWCAVGIAPLGGDHDLTADDDSDFSSPYVWSELGFPVRDFVAIYGGETGSAIHYARVFYGSASDYRIEAESTTSDLPTGVPVSGSMAANEVLDVYQFHATNGQSCTLSLDIASGSGDLALYVFKPIPYAKARNAADWVADAAGGGAGEALSFKADSDGDYGVVVVNQNGQAVDYTLTANGPLSIRIECIGCEPQTNMVIQWNTWNGRVYEVRAADQLRPDAFTNVLGVVTGAGVRATFTNALPLNAPLRYYRVHDATP